MQVDTMRGLTASEVHVGDIVYYWGHSETNKDFINMKAVVLEVDCDDDMIRVKNERFSEWMHTNRFELFHEYGDNNEIDELLGEF